MCPIKRLHGRMSAWNATERAFDAIGLELPAMTFATVLLRHEDEDERRMATVYGVSTD